MANDWKSPTGASGYGWVNASRVYDDNLGTFAHTGLDDWLEIYYSGGLWCDKVQIYASMGGFEDQDPNIKLDVFYGGNWHNILTATIPLKIWIPVSIGSTQFVTKARVSRNVVDRLNIYEFDFNAPLAVETDACSNPTPASLQGNGDTIQDGGLTVFRRGFQYVKVQAGDILEDFEWGSDTDPLTDSGGDITWVGTPGGSSKAEIDDSLPHSGTRCARLYRDGTNNVDVKFSHNPLTNDEIWSMWLKKDDGSRLLMYHGNGSKLINFELSADEGVKYYDGISVKDTGKDVVVGTWHLLEIRNVNWTAGTYDIYLDKKLAKSGAGMRTETWNNGEMRYFSGIGTVECWLDDICVGACIPYQIEVLNPSFESGVLGSVPTDWALADGDGGYAKKSTGKVKLGTYSVEAKGRDSDGAMWHYQGPYAVEGVGGKSVTLGAWLYCDTANRMRIGLREYKDGGSVGVTFAWHTSAGEWEWVIVTRTFNVDSNQVRVDVPHMGVGTQVIGYADGAILIVDDEILAVFDDGSFGEGEYNDSIEGLDSGSSYRVRAFAQSADGIAYGNVVTCETTTVGRRGSFFKMF